MSEDVRNTLLNLKIISSIDAKLAVIRGERKRFDEDVAEKRAAFEEAKRIAEDKTAVFAERKQMYQREERFLRDEQAKLVDRRKALQSLQSYKLQQAAEREIEAASKQLSSQEENLINTLDTVESLEKEASAAEEVYKGLESEFQALEAEVAGTLENLAERVASHSVEREETVKLLDEKTLEMYERVSERYPMDAVVAFKDNTCTGCFLGLGPQVMVEIGRAKSIVRCRGCGRFLYLGESEEE